MFRAWLFGVGILFVLAEFSIWLKQFMLPLPIYILGGAFLAIASNYEKGLMALFRQESASSPDVLTQTASLINQVGILPGDSLKTTRLPETNTEPTSNQENGL